MKYKSPHKPLFQFKYEEGDKKPTADTPSSEGAKSYPEDWQLQKASTGILLVITSSEMSSH